MGYDEFEMKSNEKFIVQGGNPLQGEITPSGNKNEALPVLAAVLLTEEPVILHNVPDNTTIDTSSKVLINRTINNFHCAYLYPDTSRH